MTRAARKTELFDMDRIEKEAARVTAAFALFWKTREENRRRRKENKRRKKKNKLNLLPKVDSSILRLINKEQAGKKELLTVEPEEWRQRIELFSEPLRTKIGFLVWWDFFGGRQVTERWPNLDDILANFAQLDDCSFSRDDLVLALCTVGYSPYAALARINEDSVDE